ncbi:DUF3365 domain-containing protein [Mesorhizobium intechi]|uniref:DUF3365 domain-containing protein n=1 Tax=Mesorhizobium intechi TaxID=537601 RepID=A0A8T9ARA2_9HYPH|nr:DUF3365 domain-containing protein [Mesorhizobium intechi]TSE11664.1 DUF3365 domain-containing protein [Mesorhizobium intechi]
MHDGGGHDYITFGWIATIIGLLLFAALGQSYSTSKHQSSYYAQRCAQQYPDSPFAAASVHSSAGKPEAKPSDDGQKSQPDWCDLAAQQSVAEDTTGMHWASWAGVVFTVIGIFFIWRTLNANTEAVQEAHAANRIASETAERQLRAYISPFNFDSVITDKPEPDIRVKVTFRNAGQTPAQNVRVNMEWELGLLPFEEGKHFPSIVTVDGRGSVGPGMDFFAAVRPNDPAKPARIKLTREVLSDLVDGKLKFWIFGVIEYQDIFHREQRTRFRYVMHISHENVGFSPCEAGNEIS